MGIKNIIEENKKEENTEVISIRLAKKNKNFLELLSSVTGVSQNKLINLMLEEYQKEYDSLKEE